MSKTIFVSSTYQDLDSYRRAVWGLLEKLDVTVKGMEQFGARTETPLETCLAEVEQSDIYLGIVAFRLGSVEEGTGKSFTQLEYERALGLDKEILIYLVDEENARFPVKYIDRDYSWEKLEAFKRVLRERHTVDTFVSEDDLVEKLRRDLARYVVSSQELGGAKDEFVDAAASIEKFLLVPKAVSGREVRLDVKINGRPFPVSRELCKAFNFEFGATVGVAVEIVRPEGFSGSGLNQLFMSSKLYDRFAPVTQGEVRQIYVKLEFADTVIREVETRFKPETSYVLPDFDASWARMSFTQNMLGKTIQHEAEGKIVMTLTIPNIESRADL